MSETLDVARWVERARSGNREAFDELVRAHFAEVYGVLHRMVGNHEDAEDLAQETFVRAYSSLRFYRGEGTFGAWLARIALHLAHDHHRSRGRRGPIVGLEALGYEPEAATDEPVGEITRREMVKRLGEAVDQLPHNLRAAIVLRVMEGREYEDVARATGMKPGTVRTQVMKARRLLLRHLEPWLKRAKL
jgi:RNA polymerase sigma-70 factor (ECF subfamily)